MAAPAAFKREGIVQDKADHSGFDIIVSRSLGYFRRHEVDPQSADRWLERRRSELRAAEEQLKDPPVLDWQREIAVRNGVPPQFVERLVDKLSEAPVDETSTAAWIAWLLDVVAEDPQDLPIFLRESALESVFARAFTNTDRPKATAKRILTALKTLVSMWCGGCTLVEIEDWLLAFIRKHEGVVKQQANQSHTAQRARRFAIRVAPDLGFLCGLLGQVVTYRAAAGEGKVLPVVDMLPQMVRAGDHDRHHAILRQSTAAASRVGTYETYLSLRAGFKAGPGAEIEAIREEVDTTLMMQAFTDLDDEELP